MHFRQTVYHAEDVRAVRGEIASGHIGSGAEWHKQQQGGEDQRRHALLQVNRESLMHEASINNGAEEVDGSVRMTYEEYQHPGLLQSEAVQRDVAENDNSNGASVFEKSANSNSLGNEKQRGSDNQSSQVPSNVNLDQPLAYETSGVDEDGFEEKTNKSTIALASGGRTVLTNDEQREKKSCHWQCKGTTVHL